MATLPKSPDYDVSRYWDYIVYIAKIRYDQARRAQLFDNLKQPSKGKSPYDADMVGATGEMKVAEWLGIPKEWITQEYDDLDNPALVAKSQLPDVGILHVRSTSVGTGGLIVKKRDVDGPYVLAIADLPNKRCRLAGWRLGFECKQDRFWSRSFGAFLVPQDQLYSLKSLRQYCKSYSEVSHGGDQRHV